MAKSQSAPKKLVFWTVLLLIGTLNVMSQTIAGSSDYQLLSTAYNDGGGCIFNISDEVVIELSDKISEGNFFIYINLEFSDSSSVRKDYGSNIIDPFRWVYASGGKGDLLLTLPFDFVQLSMATLKIGVSSITVKVDTDETCLQGISGNELIQDLAGTVFEVVSRSTDTAESEPFSVCIERQLAENELDRTMSFYLPGSAYILFQTSTVYDCWLDDGGVLSSNPVIYMKYKTLITCVFILGVILALYSPMAGIFFVRLSAPPPADLSFNVIAVHSDLPLGLKYNLMFAGSDFKWIRLLRWLILVIIFGLTPYIPFMAWAAKGELGIRMEAINNAGVLSYTELYGWHFFVEFPYYVTVALLLTFTFESYDLVTERLQVRKVDRRYFCLVDLPQELYIPESIEEDNQGVERRAYGFYQAMIHRAFGMVNFGLYTYFFGQPFVSIQKYIGGRSLSGWLLTFLTTIIYIIIFPFLLFGFLFSMLFYAFPICDVMLFCLRKFIHDKPDVRDILVAIGIVLLSISCFFKFIAVFVYVSELIGYTFVGFVTHTEEVGEYVMVGVLFFGVVLNAFTNFYDGYCHLLLQVVEKADQKDTALEKKKQLEESQQTIHAQSGSVDNQSSSPVTFDNLLYFNKQGVPFIKMDLFERVVNKYRPVKVEIFKIVSQLSLLAVVVLLGLSIIKTIDGFSDLPASIEVFATVIVAGVLPLFVLIVRSPGKTECLDESKWRQLEQDLENYAETGQFVSDYLQQ